MGIQPRRARRAARLLPALGGLAVLCVVIAGCGREAAVQANSPAGPKAASVPSVATAYASVVNLTLQTTVKQGSLLLEQMKSQHPSSLGTLCADAGLTYSYQYDAFRRTYTPSYARATARAAVAGYKLALSAMEECGNAADAGDSHGMKTAAADFFAALTKIASAQHTISAWASATK